MTASCLLLWLWPLAAAAEPSAAPTSISPTELNNQGVREAKQGRFETGATYLRRAVAINPAYLAARRNLSGVLTDWADQLERTGRLDQAEALLREAVEVHESNGRALARLGDLAYFKRSDFAQAIAYWKRAYEFLESAEQRIVADRVAQAQRDQLIERGFASDRTEHFEIRIQRGDGLDLPAFAQTLETAYALLEGAFGRGPLGRVAVILYTDQDLQRAYNARDWVIGFYDGRLRLLAGEIGTDLGQVLVTHELAHAFLHELYGSGVPIWVHEGFAQASEGPRPPNPEEQRLEAQVVSGASWVPLKWLDRHFTHPTGRDDTWRAYVQARLVVAALIERHGMQAFKGFLESLSQGAAIDAAYDTAFAPARWALTDRTILK